MTEIDVVLSPEGVEKAIKELRDYQKNIKDKTELLVNRLADVGADEISNITHFIPMEFYVDKGSTSKGKLVALEEFQSRLALRWTSKDALYIEFSSGITYGTNYYPLDSGKGYGMGTNSPQGHWDDPYGWYFPDKTHPAANRSGYVHTYGVPAFMPMYRATEAMHKSVTGVAIQVFNGG